jgi:hypothetical protein
MAVRKKRTTKKKINISDHIPEEFVKLWNHDYHDLDDRQRAKMVEVYVLHVQQYEWGKIKEKLDPPRFMTQTDVIETEEKKKKQERLLAAKVKEEEDRKVAKRQEKLQVLIDKWDADSLIILDKVEQLGLENLSLKIQLAEQAIINLNKKKDSLVKDQEKMAENIAEKYEVSIEDYVIDPVKGVFVRNPRVKCPHKIEDIPEE